MSRNNYRHGVDACPAIDNAQGDLPSMARAANQQKSRRANPSGIARNLAWASMAPPCHTPQMVVSVCDRLLPAIVGFSYRHLGKQSESMDTAS
jgi:hypothetical protein